MVTAYCSNLHVCVLYVSFVYIDILLLGYRYLLGVSSAGETLSHTDIAGTILMCCIINRPLLIIILIVLGPTLMGPLVLLLVSPKQTTRYQHKIYILLMETIHGLTTFHHLLMLQRNWLNLVMQS